MQWTFDIVAITTTPTNTNGPLMNRDERDRRFVLSAYGWHFELFGLQSCFVQFRQMFWLSTLPSCPSIVNSLSPKQEKIPHMTQKPPYLPIHIKYPLEFVFSILVDAKPFHYYHIFSRNTSYINIIKIKIFYPYYFK